jgi:subtilisin family serine protease
MILMLKLISLGVFIFLMGCKEEVDDQTIAKGASWSAANPTPLKRNFELINQRHEILVAVIDSGTDYNHPTLINNIHFSLTEKNEPNGFGYDFIGEDHWPAPYLARTRDLNPEADPKEAETARNARNQSTSLLKSYPQFANYLNPLRNVEQEMESGSFHGSHVAGLMVYDEPRIGLLAYRVLPLNVKYKNGKEDRSVDQTQVALKNIINAMKLAVRAGVRVINMSLALKNSDSFFGSSANEKAKYIQWMNQIKEFMHSHPQVVFVAAAGNESKWVDDKVNLQLPCGIGARNLLCVGALDKNGNLASFSNLVLSSSAFVAVEGVEINSLNPTMMCESSFLLNLKYDSKSYPFNDARSLAYAIESFKTDCLNKKPMRAASGTSMASPIVARMIAKILLENPNLSAEQAIDKIISGAEKVQLGPLLLNRLKFEKPSWYSKN